jgi:ribosomal-protein-alanine N-acetyltransferase
MTPTLYSLGETERLLLRAPSEEDLDSIAALWTDPLATKYIGGPRDRDMVLGYFRDYANDPKASVRDERDRWWSVLERSSGQFIGLCGLTEKEIEGQMESDLGYFLLPSFWGQGYAIEAARKVVQYAFSELQLESVVAVIDPINAASKSVALKLSMALERETLRSDGVVRQVYRLKR